jgi:hypothetical protein
VDLSGQLGKSTSKGCALGDDLMKFLVITADKNTGEINHKHIEAETAKDTVIEECLDGMGEIFWAVYPPTVPVEVAHDNFSDYLKYRTNSN